MATKVDFSSVFDTVLPNAYIKKVSLLPASVVGRKRAVNFDENAVYEVRKNSYGVSKVQTPGINPDSASSDPRGLTIEAEIVLKDQVLSTGKSYWFDDEVLLERMKLRVILCKDAELAKNFLQRKFTPKFMKEFRDRNLFVEQIIDLNKKVFGDISEHRKEKIDGKKAYSISFPVLFNIPNLNPKYLAVFAHTFMQASPDSSGSRRELQGTTAAEKVVENGKTKENAYIYKLPNRKVWSGPIHYHKASNSYMPGIAHTDNPHDTLKREKVSNFIVEDHRLLEVAAAQKIRLEPDQPKIVKKREENKSAHGITKILKNPYISEPSYSYTPVNRVKFMFDINFEKIIRENTQYGAIFRTADAKARNEILQRCKITNMRIFRHRVVPGLYADDTILADYDDRTELVGFSAETSAGKVPRRITYKKRQDNIEDSERIAVGAVKEIYLTSNANTGIRTIGVTDYDMARKTAGLYKYSVELEIEDGTVAFVKTQLHRLTQARNALEEYYSRAVRVGNCDPLTGRLSQDMINQQLAEYPIPNPSSILTGNKTARSQAVQNGIGQSPWLNSIAVYLDTLYNITDISYSKVLKTSRLLQQLCDPVLGTVSGLEILMELIQKLEQQIRIATGPVIRRMDEVDYDEPTTAYKGKISKATFSINKYFKEVHDSDILNHVGYDFIGGHTRKSIGPRLVTPEQYSKRADTENAKYYNAQHQETSAEADIDEASSERGPLFTAGMNMQEKYYSYFSPKRILFGKETSITISPNRKMWEPTQYTNLIATILACSPNTTASEKMLVNESNPKKRWSKFSPPVSFAQSNKLANLEISTEAFGANIASSLIFGDIGVTLSTPALYDTKMKTADTQQGLEEDERNLRDPRDILGDDSKFWTDDLAVEDIALTDSVITNIQEEEDLSEINSMLFAPLIKSNSSENIFPSESRVAGVQDLNPHNEENIIDKYFATRTSGEAKKAKFIQKQPNQIKSILLASDTARTRRKWFEFEDKKGIDLFVSPRLSGVLYFLFNHINGVEVMTGYERDSSGKENVSRPMFKLMDNSMFENIRKTGATVLCRMTPYSNSMLQLGKSPKMSMPEYDLHFLLGPRTKVPESSTTTITTTAESSTSADSTSTSMGVFVDRLTEYAPMNDTGNKLLKAMVYGSTLTNGLPTEYSSTTFIQQPLSATRVGTNFTTETSPPGSGPSSSQASSALRDGRASRQTSTRATSNTMGSTSASNYSGEY
jgi:hypothetical protein